MRHRYSFQAYNSPNTSGTWLIIGCEFLRGTRGAHIILWNSNGHTCYRSREGRIHWTSLARGRAGRLRHQTFQSSPERAGWKRRIEPRVKESGDAVLLTGSQTTPTRARHGRWCSIQVKIDRRPGQTRRAAQLHHQGYPCLLMHFLFIQYYPRLPFEAYVTSRLTEP